MTCTVDARGRVREAAAELRACDGVVGVDVLEPGTGTARGWSLELVTETHPQPAMLERLATHNLGLADVTPRCPAYRSVAVP